MNGWNFLPVFKTKSFIHPVFAHCSSLIFHLYCLSLILPSILVFCCLLCTSSLSSHHFFIFSPSFFICHNFFLFLSYSFLFPAAFSPLSLISLSFPSLHPSFNFLIYSLLCIQAPFPSFSLSLFIPLFSSTHGVRLVHLDGHLVDGVGGLVDHPEDPGAAQSLGVDGARQLQHKLKLNPFSGYFSAALIFYLIYHSHFCLCWNAADVFLLLNQPLYVRSNCSRSRTNRIRWETGSFFFILGKFYLFPFRPLRSHLAGAAAALRGRLSPRGPRWGRDGGKAALNCVSSARVSLTGPDGTPRSASRRFVW